MDSGNSDSFQSSNGVDDDYNSRGGGGDAISAFINPPVTQGSGGLIHNPPPHEPMFNPIIPNYRNIQNNMLLNNNNLEMVWSRTLRSDPNQLFTVQNSNLQSSSPIQDIITNTNSKTSSLPLTERHETHGLPYVQNPNPKKRSRASRRAPTTVLTTDTTNFRAMVQEFTGIPTPPFTSSSSTTYSSLFPRNIKLDNIFCKPNSSMRCSNNNNPLDNSISLSYQPPILTSSIFGASTVDSLRTNVENGYQSLQWSNLFTMQNPILASMLQSNPDKPIIYDNPSIFKSKTHHGSIHINSSNGVLHELGSLLGQDLVDDNGSLPRLVSADPARWGRGAGGVSGGGADQVRSFGNNNGEFDDFSRNVGNGKRLKRMMEDGVVCATRQGMTETWIYSSTE